MGSRCSMGRERRRRPYGSTRGQRAAGCPLSLLLLQCKNLAQGALGLTRCVRFCPRFSQRGFERAPLHFGSSELSLKLPGAQGTRILPGMDSV